jgi:hypothetical protein
MKLAELGTGLGLRDLTPEVTRTTAELTAGYVSDLLSDVLAHAPRGGVLVTVQVHLNVIAVALHAELAAVIFAQGRLPEDGVRLKAVEEGIALYASDASAFDLVGQLYALGLRGPQD